MSDHGNTNNARNQTRPSGRRTQAGATLATALNPSLPALTQPAKSLVEKGHIASLTVVFRPTGTEVVGRAGPRLIAAGLDGDTNHAVGILIDAARNAGLVGKSTKGGAKGDGAQELPKKSLCERDFEESALPRLQQRCNAVAAAAGGGTLVGRVRSGGSFAAEATTPYSEWWATASPQDRLLSLADARNRGKITPEQVAAMANVNCPFRGNLEFVVAAEEEEAEEGQPE